jgi:hypothetical protein
VLVKVFKVKEFVSVMVLGLFTGFSLMLTGVSAGNPESTL